MKAAITVCIISLVLLAGCGAPTSTVQYAIGDTGPAGGYVFYDKGSYSDGWRYMEVAPASTEWGNTLWSSSTGSIGTSTAIGTGKGNTTAICAWLLSASENSMAAQYCEGLTFGGKNDWFLPSKEELDAVYDNLYAADKGDLADDMYWSSSEYSASQVHIRSFPDGLSWQPSKDQTHIRTRAVRMF